MPHKRKHIINDNFFDKWSHDMAYILGFTAADGNIYKYTLSFKIQRKDIEILHFIKSKLGNAFLEEKDNWVRIRFNSQKMIEKLKEYNLTPNKSYTIEVPKQIPKKYFGDYIRGVIDGDGCVYSRKYGLSCEVYSASKNFIEQLNTMMGNLGKIRLRDYKNDPTRKPQYHISIQNNRNIILLRNLIYYSESSFGLKRKRDIFFSKF